MENKSDFLKTINFMEKRFWPFILGTIGDNLLVAFCYNIVMAIIMRDLFNAASQGSTDLFLRAIVIGLVSLTIALIIRPYFIYLSKKAQKSTMKEIRLKAFNHMTELPISYFEKEHSGNVLSRLTNDIKIIEDIYDTHFNRIAFILLLGLGSATLMFVYDWRIALYALFFEGLSIASSIIICRKVRKTADLVQENRSEVNQKLLNLLYGFKTTKIFQVEKDVLGDYKSSNEKLASLEKEKDNLEALINTSSYFFNSAKSIGIIVIGLYLVSQKTWDIGTLVAMGNLQNNVGILSDFGDALGKMQGSLAGVKRVSDFLEESAEIGGERGLGQLHEQHTGEHIQIKEVSFSYENQKVLDKLSITIRKGETIALVGRSGCGKSTLAKLFLGFYKVIEGELWVDGKEISKCSLENLRDKVAYVPQTPYLFDETIKENIRYGNLNVTEEEIIEAAMKANAHDFIMAQENGYDTKIGEGGVNLSGGQKQRIAIARAIIKGAEILLLDEATAALDNTTEEIVMDTLNSLMGEKTVIIIAHRLATLIKADLIYVLDQGEVVQQGNHEDLMAMKGLYFNLYNAQLA